MLENVLFLSTPSNHYLAGGTGPTSIANAGWCADERWVNMMNGLKAKLDRESMWYVSYLNIGTVTNQIASLGYNVASTTELSVNGTSTFLVVMQLRPQLQGHSCT